MMQNQEFLELLKRDADFMKTLEKGKITSTEFEIDQQRIVY